MSKIELSDFAQAALKLDEAFQEFARLARELDRAPIETESGMDRAKKLLVHVQEVSQRLDEGMRTLVQTVGSAQSRASELTEQVTARARQIRDRQQETNQIYQRYHNLSLMAKEISTIVSEGGQFPDIDSKLGHVVEEARALMDEAREAKLKSLERDSDALRQSLQSARNKLSELYYAQHPKQSEPVH